MAADDESPKSTLLPSDATAGETELLRFDEADARADPTSWRVRALLPILLAVFVHNQWSRSLIYYVVNFGSDATAPDAARDLMNVELGFGTETYGALASLPFVLAFAPLSLVAGVLCDKADRARLTWVSLLGWSAATFWQGSAGSAAEVAASRVAQGFAQAFTTPAAYTLLADVTPPARRGTVNSVYSTGVYLGGGLAALSILLDAALGWRDSLRLSAALGVALALGSAVALEDPRARREASPAGGAELPGVSPAAARAAAAAPALGVQLRAQLDSLGRTVAVVCEQRAVQLLLASCTLRFCAGFSIAVWVGPWGREAFPLHEADFSLAKAFISGVGGSCSAIAGGMLSDRLGEREPVRRLWLPIAGSVGASAAWVMMMQAESFETAMVWLLLQYVLAECWFGATIASLQHLLPKEVQGGAQGVFSMLTVLGNFAPLLIGELSRSRPLEDVLVVVVPALYLASALAFALTCQQFAPTPELSSKGDDL